MAAGLAALLDDIAALAKVAAASVDDVSAAAGRASMKAAGVVVDDTAVTPRYVSGFTADRELPMIRRIAVGSLRNKLLFILPAALLLSQFLPWLLTPILMVGGTYLAFEGAEKLYELVTGHGKESAESPHVPDKHEAPLPSTAQGEDTEKSMVAGAIRTDFILSAEIMVIALNEVSDQPFISRAISLVLVALGITALVYGVVALIVKMDDIGLRLAATKQGGVAATGRFLVRAMPKVLAVLSTVGIIAMLWVGGHILLVGADELGWHAPYELVHHAEEAVHHAVAGLGGFLAWLTNTLASALAGLVVGAVVVAVMHVIPRRKGAAAAH
jgi:predicted DNA repair protein MutK